jgi:hypothetical protein
LAKSSDIIENSQVRPCPGGRFRPAWRSARSLGSLIADTRKAVDDDPGNAQALFTAQGTLVGVTEVDIQTGAHSFKVDEPPALGGADVAANPVQYALASLGSCQAITYQLWAEQLGIGFDTLSVRVEGDLVPVTRTLAS